MRVGSALAHAIVVVLTTLGSAAESAGLLQAISNPAGSPDVLPRIAVEDDLSGDVPRILVPTRRPPIPLMVRVLVPAAVDERALEGRLQVYRDRRLPVWLAIGAPASVDAVPAWRARLEGVLSRAADGIAILEIGLDDQGPQLAAFAVRLAATEARARHASVRIALGGPRFGDSAARRALYAPEIVPYVDLLAVPFGSNPANAIADIQARDPSARVVVTGGDPGGSREEAAERLLGTQLEFLGTDVAVHSWRAADSFEAALPLLAPVAGLMSGQVSSLNPGAALLSFSHGGQNVTATTRHRLLFDERTFATYLVIWSEPSNDSLLVTLTLPVEGVPAVHRLLDGTRLQPSGYTRNPETGRVQLRVPVPGGPVLIDFNEGAGEVFVERSGVSAERQLTVEEVIARHQQQQRAQDRLVRSYIATARMEQHFRPTMTDPGYDVVSENRYYVADDGIEWEELTFSVNGSKWGSDRPPFPLLQPEKVLSLPLQLRFTADYRYRLAGMERVRGYDCYVVRFEPVAAGQSFYRGTLWIERRTFARVQVQAVQTGLSAPVVSNEEIQSYQAVASLGNAPVFLFTGLDARQIMLIAGRNLLVEKRVTFGDFRINDDRFAESRAEARRSDRIMFRETDRGLRYYVKKGEERVVSDRPTTRAKAMAMGVVLDPSYGFPLPILGINYLNFEFQGRPDTQLAILFAGVLAAGNLQRPKFFGPFDASVDFFAIAAPSSERLYDSRGERDRERLLTWPLTTGANLGWQFTPFQKLSGHYQFRFDGYARERTTSDDFRVPASTLTNGVGASWEYRRAGYSAIMNGSWFVRANWRDWGFSEAAPDVEPRYVKFSASLSRDFYVNVFHKIHLNAAWFGGRDLDRFAKYQFGMFDDTRLHGVPASGVRFGELGVARGSYSLNIFEQYRLDLFLEQAWGRDTAFDRSWQPIAGFGAALNFRAPWNTILRADFGKSILPDRYSGTGSATLQIMLLKPLR